MNELTEIQESQPSPVFPRWVNTLFKYKYTLLLFCLFVAIPCNILSSFLMFNQSIESFYSPDNPQLQDFLQTRTWFGGDEILLVVWTQPNLVNQEGSITDEGLEEILNFETAFEDIPGVEKSSIQSIGTMLKPKEGKLLLQALLKFPVIRNKMVKFSEGFLISEDHKTVGILLRLIPEKKSSIKRKETYRLIREIANRHQYPAHVVGEPIQVHDMFQYVQQDGAVLGWTTMLIVTFVLFVLFRSFRWVVLPIVVVTIAIFVTRSLLYLSGLELSMVSSILNSLMMIIGVATLTHMIVYYREYRKIYDSETSLKLCFKNLLRPVFWTTLTTIMGFASLLTSSVSPVRSFGAMVSLGTLMVMLISLLIIPGFMLIGKVADPKSSFGEQPMSSLLAYIAGSVLKRPLPIVIVLITFMLFCGLGMTFLQVETDFSRNFRSSTPIVQALDFVENNLGGAGTWEINFKAPPLVTPEFAEKISLVTEELRAYKEPGSNRPAFTKVVSLSDGLSTIPDRVLFFRFDDPEKKLAQINNFQKEFQANLYKRDVGRMRIILRGYERLPAEKKLKIIEHAKQIAARHLEDVHATGLYVLLAYLIESLLGDQIVSFAISASAIFVMMSIAFRSIILGLISLIPNVFPLLVLMGTLGWLGIPTNIGTAMIASVSLGLTVDSSIHYLAGYLQVIKAGGTHHDAVFKTNDNVGLALLFANLALVLGFLVLMLSNFIPLVYFGLLVALAMLGGLIGNLILLPATLSFIYAK